MDRERELTMAAARKLDAVAPGAGEALFEASADAIKSARLAAVRVRKSETESRIGAQ